MNAIVSAATGYAEADLRPFVRSLAAHCCDVTVFLIVFRNERSVVKDLASRHGVRIEPVYAPRAPVRAWRLRRWMAERLSRTRHESVGPLMEAMGTWGMPIVYARHFIARRVLRAQRSRFTHVLLTDSRDVLFQGDPFARPSTRVTTGLEAELIGASPFTARRLEELYGRDEIVRLSRRRVTCAGVTIGPAREVERYLDTMCAEIWRRLPDTGFTHYGDQAIHNHIVHIGAIEVELVDNASGYIATLHTEAPGHVRVDATTGLIEVRGRVPTIVHQYDRLPDVARVVRR